MASLTRAEIIAKATTARINAQAYRAVDDPVKLARAARIVRAALARQRLTLADLVDSPDTGAA